MNELASAPFSDALRPLAERMARAVREHEILRVAGSVGAGSGDREAGAARDAVLEWAENRVGDRLPKAAWEHGEFEQHTGGRDRKAVRLVDGAADLWALRADDPDSTVAGRVWTTEVSIGFKPGGRAHFGLRLLVSSPEPDLSDMEPAVPGFLQRVARERGLYQRADRLASGPWLVGSDGDAERLVETMLDPERREPVFVLTVQENAVDPTFPLMDPEPLARATLGLAKVVVLPARRTWALTERLGKRLSVFGGAVRTYLPGFAEDANPHDHELFLAERLWSPEGPHLVAARLKRIAAAESLRRLKLGKDVLSFLEVRTRILEITRKRLEHESAEEDEQLSAARTQIENLEERLEVSDEDQLSLLEHLEETEEKLKRAERQLESANYRIQQLTSQLATRGDRPDENISLPDSWTRFPDWCDLNLDGRVILSPRARREVKAPKFDDPEIAARCLLWLANDYREARLEGVGDDLRKSIGNGIRHDRCGDDSFRFKWRGRWVDVGWHVKNGGNTRDPKRCLRIYYFWDTENREVIVASMPDHIRTGAT